MPLGALLLPGFHTCSTRPRSSAVDTTSQWVNTCRNPHHNLITRESSDRLRVVTVMPECQLELEPDRKHQLKQHERSQRLS